jgi:hypothetical protein
MKNSHVFKKETLTQNRIPKFEYKKQIQRKIELIKQN